MKGGKEPHAGVTVLEAVQSQSKFNPIQSMVFVLDLHI